MREDKFILPTINPQLAGFAKQFIKSYGLGLIKPKLFQPNASKMSDEESYYVADSDKKSAFGLPIFDQVTFDPIKYTDENGKEINTGTVPLTLDIAIIEVNQQKNIVKTQRAGKNGSIKEYMGLGDYSIVIRGWLVNPIATTNPKELAVKFHEFAKAPIDLKVNSTFLNYFGIYNIVVESYRIAQVEGQRNVFEYEFTCSDESPFEIEYNKEQSQPMF